MEVYKCGMQVTGIVGDWYGIITSVIIRFDTVYYEVSTQNHEIVVKHECEFRCREEKAKIGFNKKQTA